MASSSLLRSQLIKWTIVVKLIFGCMPNGSYDNTHTLPKKGSDKVLGVLGIWGRLPRSEKGSQNGFLEGGLKKVSRTPPRRVRPLRCVPYLCIFANECACIRLRFLSTSLHVCWHRLALALFFPSLINNPSSQSHKSRDCDCKNRLQ